MQNYKEKYLKYKAKYLNSKNMTGGNPNPELNSLTILSQGIESFRNEVGKELSDKLRAYSEANEQNRIAVIELFYIHNIKSSDGKLDIDKAKQLLENFLYIVEKCGYHRNDAVILAINNLDDNIRYLLGQKIARFFIMKYVGLDEIKKEKFIADIKKGISPLFAGHVLHLLGNLNDGEEDKLIDFINKKTNASLMEIIDELNLIRKCAGKT